MNSTNGLRAVKDIFGFSFGDSKWRSKYLVGSALIFAGAIVPVLPWLPVMGYGTRILRRSAQKGAEGVPGAAALPEWEDWNSLFIDGLRQFGVSFILLLPLLLLMTVGYGLYFLSFLWMGGDGNGEPGALFLLSFIILWLSIGLSILLSLVTMLLLAPAQAHVAVRQDFSAFLRVNEWWAVLRSNLGGFLVVLFFLMGMYTGIMFALQLLYITIVLCCLIPLLVAPLGFYALVLYYHASGLAYGESSQSAVNSLSVETSQVIPDPGEVDIAAGI